MEKHLYTSRNQKPVLNRSVIFLFFTLILFYQNSFGQIAAWDFNLAAGNEATIAATTLNANLNSTSISRGAGIASSALANSYASTGFDATSIANAESLNEYVQFTIKANSGYQVSLSTLNANFRRSSTGPNNFQWEYSLNGFASAGVNIGSAISYTLTNTNGDTQTQINLSGISALQNVTSSTTITIRLYASGASASGGTFALGRLAGNDLAVGGTVALSALAPTKLAITAITPLPPTSGNTFSVTVESQDVNSTPSNVSANTGISLSTNGNSGTIGGTTSGTINGGTNSVIISGVTLSGTGSGTTITATRTSGDVLTAGTSTGFSVLPVAPVAVAANPVGPTSFTANWGSVTGAVLYKLDVLSALPYNTEDFTDGNFTSGPAWAGSTANYSVLTNATLPNGLAATDGSFLGCNASVGTASLYTPATETSQWEFSLGSSDFAPSSGNYFGVVLMSDNTFTSNISSFNGYYIRIGVDGATDFIELWRSTGLTKTQVGSYSGGPNLGANALRDGLNIKITRNSSGVFQLFYSTGFLYGAVPVTSAGTLTDNTYSASSYFGVFTNFANPAATRRLYIDNITVTGMGGEVFVPGYSNLTVIGTSQSVTGLTFGQTYYYRLRAVSTGGTSANSNTITATTACDIVSQPDAFTAFSTDVCPSLTGVAYTVPNDPTVTYNWSYTGGTGATINGTGNSITVDFSPTATSGTLEVTATSIYGCGTSAARTIAITVEVPATITCIGNVTQGNDSPLCNAVVTYGAPTVGGTSPTVTYLFSGATSGSGSGDASGSTFNVGITTVTLTATNTCASPSCAFDVEVTKTSPTAPTSVTSNDVDNAICIGGSIDLTANGAGLGSAGGQINWYEGGCGISGGGVLIGTGATLSNLIPSSAGTHVYYAQVEDACNEVTTCASISIVVNPGPPANTITAVNAPAEACSGNVALVTLTTAGGPGITYSWVQGTGSNTVLFSNNIGGPFAAGPIATASSQVYAQFGAPTGWSGYYVCAQAVNGCGSTADLCKWVRGIVSGPGPITPATQVVACPNDVKNYSCGPSAGASVYTWTLNGSQAPITPNGGNNTSVQVTFPSNFVSGQLCVTAALACQGSSISPPRCISISNNPSGVGTITGPATVCSGATNVSYSVPSVPGASGYNWTVPSNATITSGTNTIAITVDFPTPFTGTGSVCVSATGPCGTSSTKCKSVVSGLPNIPAGITGPLSNVCNSTVQYSVVNPVVSSYTWTPPTGTTISSGQGTSTIQLTVSPTFTSGYLTVVANSSLCIGVSSPPRVSSTFWGKPNTPGLITQNPPGPFCSGDPLNFSVVNQTPGTIPVYAWTSSNGAITAGQGTDNINVTWGTNGPGTITVKASNGCGVSAGTRSQVYITNNCREEGTNTSSTTSFSIYPNPAHDNLTVSIKANEHADFSLQLIDVSGRVVLADSRKGLAGLNIYELDISNLSTGVYMLEVKSVNDKWRTKVVVE